MRNPTRQTRENRTITVDFQNEATYFQLLGDGKAFVECVMAFLLALGFQLAHKATCRGGGCLTRHSHYGRIRLGGLTIWRLQCTTCRAVFTVLPHFVLRYRQMRPEVARDALLATHGGLSLELCAVIHHLSPMALYRLVCALGQHSLVTERYSRSIQCLIPEGRPTLHREEPISFRATPAQIRAMREYAAKRIRSADRLRASGVHAHRGDRSERRGPKNAHFAKIGAERILENHGRLGK
jgi:hypothetical protein